MRPEFTEGERVSLLGTLEAAGPLCPSFEDEGVAVAVTTAQGAKAGSVTARAERLSLLVDGREERYDDLHAVYVAAKNELLIPGSERFANEYGDYGKISAILAWKGICKLAERRPAAPSDAKVIDLARYRRSRRRAS